MGILAVSKLESLHRRLDALRRRRWLLRFAAAASLLLLVALGLLAACFAVDYLGQLNRPARAVALLVWLAVTLWATVRYLLPACRPVEQELDVALLVEQQQHIDSDLVAALQFEAPQASGWGSRQLADAVIARVANVAQGLDVFGGLTYAPTLRRVAAAALTLAVLAVAGATFPGHAGAFFNRFLLGTGALPHADADRSAGDQRPRRAAARFAGCRHGGLRAAIGVRRRRLRRAANRGPGGTGLAPQRARSRRPAAILVRRALVVRRPVGSIGRGPALSIVPGRRLDRPGHHRSHPASRRRRPAARHTACVRLSRSEAGRCAGRFAPHLGDRRVARRGPADLQQVASGGRADHRRTGLPADAGGCPG